MAPPRWATPEQSVFLTLLVPIFREHQRVSTVRRFWPFVHTEYFGKWPEWKSAYGGTVMPTMNAEEKSVYGALIEKRKKVMCHICHLAELY